MKLKLECIACILKQIIEAGRMSTDDESVIRRVINTYATIIPDLDLNETAPQVTERMHALIRKEAGEEDPYREYKEKHIKLALEHYHVVKKIIEESDDTVEAAVMMAATGNSIDAGLNMQVDLKEVIESGVSNGFYLNDFPIFKEKLEKAENILIVADNSGEGVFDKLLIEELNNKYRLNIYYAVRSRPVLNDITLKEARYIGLDQVCHLIDSGCKAPGMLIDMASEEFMRAFRNADIVISKGQGNYEGLSETERAIFYLLKAKCLVIAREFGVPEGVIIFKYLA
jgi:damage-control phosphatase, subfamily I